MDADETHQPGAPSAADLAQDLGLCACEDCWRAFALSFEHVADPQEVGDAPTRPCPCGECDRVLARVCVTMRGSIGCALHLSWAHLRAAGKPDLALHRAWAHYAAAETLAHKAVFLLANRDLTETAPSILANIAAFCKVQLARARAGLRARLHDSHDADSHDDAADDEDENPDDVTLSYPNTGTSPDPDTDQDQEQQQNQAADDGTPTMI
jgi:hypothetical protein